MIESLLRWPLEWWSGLPSEFAFLLALPFCVAAAALFADFVRRHCARRG